MITGTRVKIISWLILVAVSGLIGGIPLCSAGDTGKKNVKQLVILTSFWPEFYNPFIEQFEKSRPDIRVQVLNKKTTAAIAEIIRGNNRNFDLFWSSSPDAFVVLKEMGRLSRSDYIPHYSPISRKQPYYDTPGQYYYDFALSGVGFMWNQKTLDELRIKPPGRWLDLMDSRFYGQVAMSTPSRSGTTHLIVESILQEMGWERGWAVLSQISLNMKTITARSFSVPDGVASGRFGVGLVIDFLAFAKVYADASNHFSYGEPTFLMPARIAVLKGGRNVSESISFIDFLLSKLGQDVLLQPGIKRLPVSKEPFANYEVEVPYLISLIRQGATKSYDTQLSTKRYNLVNTLFDQVITYRLLDRKRVWKKMLDLEEKYGKEKRQIADARTAVLEIVSRIPVSENMCISGELTEIFPRGGTASGQGERKRQVFQEWERFVTEQLNQAQNIIESVRDDLSSADTGVKEEVQ